jgi:hypothetical protein
VFISAGLLRMHDNLVRREPIAPGRQPGRGARALGAVHLACAEAAGAARTRPRRPRLVPLVASIVPVPPLTKSAFVDGLRCRRLLWLDHHRPDLRSPPTLDERRRLEHGLEVGRRARAAFPGGVLIRGTPFDLDRARRETAEALASDAPALFEPLFEHGGVRVVADVLRRDEADPDAWHLLEVKASTRLKAPRHVQDAAVQAHVLRACGLDLRSVSILHLNRDFVAPDRGELFAAEDVTRLLDRADAPTVVAEQRRGLAQEREPDVAIGSHCKNPYRCPFQDHCWAPYGTRTIFHVPGGIPYRRRRELAERGQIRLDDVRDWDLLKPSERSRIELVLDREVRIDRDAIRRRLDQLTYPLHFLDFEAIDDPIPRYPGTRPYQHVPFQFSCHVLHEDGRVEHRDYLHEAEGDPRPALTAALVAALNERGSLIAYHATYERLRMEELAHDLPAHAAPLRAAIARLWDQEPIFRAHYVDWRFEGRTSIKKVLPVLCPDLSYEGLEVASGTEAMAAWDAAVHGRDEDPEATFAALRAYCRQDTWAMVRIHRVLVETAFAPGAASA